MRPGLLILLCLGVTHGLDLARKGRVDAAGHNKVCVPHDPVTGEAKCCLINPETFEMQDYVNGQITPPEPFSLYGCYCQEGQRVCNNTKAEEDYYEMLSKKEDILKDIKEEQEARKKKELERLKKEDPFMSQEEKDETLALNEIIHENDKYIEPEPTKPKKMVPKKKEDVYEKMKKLEKNGGINLRIPKKEPEAYKDPNLEKEFQRQKEENRNSIIHTEGERSHRPGEYKP